MKKRIAVLLSAVLLLMAAAAVWFILRRRAALRADVAGSRNRSATKMARKRLSTASEFLQKDLYTAFYEELHKTLLGFISDKALSPTVAPLFALDPFSTILIARSTWRLLICCW